MKMPLTYQDQLLIDHDFWQQRTYQCEALIEELKAEIEQLKAEIERLRGRK